MDRSAVVTFSAQLREAREIALRDSEACDGVIYVVERLGGCLCEEIRHLGWYKEAIENKASLSALAEDIPGRWRGVQVPFSLLYDLATDARNDALHQGAFARRLTGHAIALLLVLQDALRRSLDRPNGGRLHGAQSHLCRRVAADELRSTANAGELILFLASQEHRGLGSGF